MHGYKERSGKERINRMIFVLIIAVMLFAGVVLVSLMIGTKIYGPSTIWEALFHRNQKL